VFSDTVPVAVVWAVAMALAAWRTRDWVASTFLLIAVGSEKLVYLMTTLVVDRPRPDVETVGHVYSTSSFPSGHVGAAVALWGGLALLTVWSGRVRARAGTIGLTVAVVVVALLVGASRIYQGVHHPLDVAAGALLGLSCLAAAHWAVLAPHARRNVGGAQGVEGTARPH
jgi:undecaprenyl-diphosphatase